jgi:putative 4-mercaptohistidine N1-methyltranferase
MSEIYESDKLLSEYLLFHFGQDREILGPERNWPEGMREALGFAVRTVRWFSAGRAERGLDLGCSVGRSAFEMARDCGEVIGIDFSHAFVRAAETLRGGGTVAYDRTEEGRLKTRLEARAPFEVAGLAFQQGDAMNLAPGLGDFDRVHAANLLCRLPEPLRLLRRFPSLVRTGGELVLATPCTWLEDFTPAGNWPEGETFDWLHQWLSPAFELVRRGEEPFLIRETARKFQWTHSMVTVWKRL